MRCISVFWGLRKGKHMGAIGFCLEPTHGVGWYIALVAVVFFFLADPVVSAAADGSMTTRSNGAKITGGPGTGDRTMKTPEPKPQEQYDGPKTIIVYPEVYPNRPGTNPPPPQPPVMPLLR